jgi:hypothetical protein
VAAPQAVEVGSGDGGLSRSMLALVSWRLIHGSKSTGHFAPKMPCISGGTESGTGTGTGPHLTRN